MKTELREVTVKQEVYIADDGTVFTDEDECQDHEFNLIRKTFKCYDHNYNESDVDACTFAYLPTSVIVDNFIKVCDINGLVSDGVNKPGLYMYSDYLGGHWINMDEAMIRIKGVLTDDKA